jgi:protoporphyrinogen/coproporphyrinogen III oxidase
VTSPAVAVIGGGISGLAAAYELHALGVPFVLLEHSSRCGGVVLTERIGGYTIDAGPDALLTQKPAAIDLCREVGLASRLRPQLGRKTFVVRTRRLRELPNASVLGIPTRWMPFVTTDAFSWHGKLRMATEPLWPPSPATGDESISSFIGRRFGQEAVAYLAEPLLAGIHGGDPSLLSMRSAFPRFLELEAKHGSVIAGLRKIHVGRSLSNAQNSAPFVSLPHGMCELTDALIRLLPAASLRTNTGVDQIVETAGGYTLTLRNGEKMDVPAVLLATPPHATQQLARSFDLALAHLCGRIRAASVVTVALGYPRSAVRHPLDGAGVVVPRREKFTIRALSWVSSKWADRAPEDRVLLRAYLGGIKDQDAIGWSDEALIAAACRDTATLVGTTGDPELARVYRWRDSTPQLEVGHIDLMASVEHRLSLRPNLRVSASGFRGTGIADCVADARHQARKVAEWLEAAGYKAVDAAVATA